MAGRWGQNCFSGRMRQESSWTREHSSDPDPFVSQTAIKKEESTIRNHGATERSSAFVILRGEYFA